MRWGVRLVLYPSLLALIALAWHMRQSQAQVSATPAPLHVSPFHSSATLHTADGRTIALAAVGDFELEQSWTLGFDIQERTVALTPDRTVFDRLAMLVHGHRVEITTAGRALLDGRPLRLASGHRHDLGHGAWVRRDAARYTIVWPGTGPRPTVTMRGASIQIKRVPRVSDKRGVFGTVPDGDPGNDLVTAAGVVLPAGASAAAVHSFLESWRVSGRASLFTDRASHTTGRRDGRVP